MAMTKNLALELKTVRASVIVALAQVVE